MILKTNNLELCCINTDLKEGVPLGVGLGLGLVTCISFLKQTDG